MILSPPMPGSAAVDSVEPDPAHGLTVSKLFEEREG